jgi:hypothetical protein
MNDYKFGYKVVLVKGDKRVSFIEDRPQGMLEYKLWEPTLPQKNCGPICVFGNYKRAFDFLLGELKSTSHGDKIGEIYTCRFIPSYARAIYVADDGISIGYDRTPKNILPYGTYLAKVVIITQLYKRMDTMEARITMMR